MLSPPSSSSSSSSEAAALRLVLLLLLPQRVFLQFQVIYRENNELLANSSEPVRFWELVEYRPTPPPPPTTLPPTTTPPPPPTTTADPCESQLPAELSRRLRDDAGGYNDIYMAADFATARHAFRDLRTFAHRPPTHYECGRRCQRSSRLIRRIIRTGAQEIATRTWWDHNEWERDVDDDVDDETSRRRRRAVAAVDDDDVALMRNTGTSRHVLGMTVAVQCDDDDDGRYNVGGYAICTSCRAVRHLPAAYFPRVINEVICSQKACLHGEGKCVQRVMPMKVLRNVGSRECARWQLSSIDVRTCCDCVLSPSSPLVAYL